MNQRIITVVGGTGFVGKYVVKRLAREGYTVRVVSRDPQAALELKTAGDVGQIVLEKGDLARPDTLQEKLRGSYAVINLVGILFEHGAQRFSALHAQGAERLAQMAKAAHVPHYVHLSSLGADKAGSSKYARTKFLGEKATVTAFPEATVLRPSIIFGPEDHFFNKFAAMACISPALPLIGGGYTRFQPVYVGDVAQAAVLALTHPDMPGKTYELGGPQTYSFREILEFILKVTRRSPLLAPVPFTIASLLAAFTGWLPHPPLTADQVRLLKFDNVVARDALTFKQLGIVPASVGSIVPAYLERFKRQTPRVALS